MEMTKNYIFRKFICNLTKRETAKLLSKNVTYITLLDKGKEIKPEYKRLMRLYSRRELEERWHGFRFIKDRLETPDGRLVTPEQVMIGLALLEIQAPHDNQKTTQIIRTARAIAKISH